MNLVTYRRSILFFSCLLVFYTGWFLHFSSSYHELSDLTRFFNNQDYSGYILDERKKNVTRKLLLYVQIILIDFIGRTSLISTTC
jgi:hypothetical protein